jgi:8-oxo-dGTP pyrophosphatase MutT (NUDIX family)
MRERDVVTSFLRDRGRILILPSNSKVGTYQGRWTEVSGHLEKDDQPITTPFKEIEEELGLRISDIQLVKSGEPLCVPDRSNDILRILSFSIRIQDRCHQG